MNSYLNKFFYFGGTTIDKVPDMPDAKIGIGKAEYHKSINVQVADDWLPDYVVDPQKDLYAASNEDIEHAIASGELTVSDMSLRIAGIAAAGGGFI